MCVYVEVIGADLMLQNAHEMLFGTARVDSASWRNFLLLFFDTSASQKSPQKLPTQKFVSAFLLLHPFNLFL